MTKLGVACVTVVLAMGVSSAALAGGTYKFTVACGDRWHAEQWDTGAVDPGHDYLQGVTGTSYPNCTVRDYSPNDGPLPVNHRSDVGGVVAGIPLVGTIIDGIFGGGGSSSGAAPTPAQRQHNGGTGGARGGGGGGG